VKKTDEVIVGYLNREEIQALLDAPDPSSRSGLRDRAMLHLAFAGGLRVSELIGLNMADLVLHPQPTVHVMGKGRRERVLPLWKETTIALRDWLRVRGEPRTTALFLNARRLLDQIGFRVHSGETPSDRQRHATFFGKERHIAPQFEALCDIPDYASLVVDERPCTKPDGPLQDRLVLVTGHSPEDSVRAS
jgi:site-specific recombinase XerC